MSNLCYECVCSYCGNKYIAKRKGSKYCGDVCRREADKDNKRITYVGKRENVCRQCGKELPKFKTKFCSQICNRRWYSIHVEEKCFDHGVLTKICPVCGEQFETQKSRQNCCSAECSDYYHNHRPYDAEQYRSYYLRNHPDARSMAEIIETSQKRIAALKIEREQRAQAREKERAIIRAKKEEIKQANIAYWQQYNAEHECEDCGEKYIAHHPFTKYCPTCKKRQARERYDSRYKGITIDKDITLKKLAKRDHNICWICGLFVDWTDKRPGNNTMIVGDMYPSIDHVTPISKGGLHSWDNVALAHMKCNTWKSNKDIKKVAK